MAITYGFYNSKDGDRKYYARQVSKIVDSLVKDGVFMHIEEHLNVKQGTGMQVLVEPGFAWFNHTWTQNDADYPLAIEASDLLQPRIDAVVLEVDESLAVRANAIKVIKGTPAAIPQKPTLTNTAEVHQYPLAYVSVAVGVTEITNANIENRIGMSDCPFVTAVLEGMNIDTLVQQWEAQFSEWLNGLKAEQSDWESQFYDWFNELEDTLSGDVAGNLLLMIQNLEKHAVYEYSAMFKVDSWEGDGPYTQTATLTSRDGGPDVTENSIFMPGVSCEKTTSSETNEILQDNLTLFQFGYSTISETNQIKATLFDKPTSDIEVIWTLKEGNNGN